VAYPFAIPCGSGSGKMDDPGINPSDRIDGIRTIRGDIVANEKILRNRFIHPFFKPMLFFNRPPAITDFPNLIRGFIQCLAEAWSGGKKDQDENKKRHHSILKRMTEDCQQEERAKLRGPPSSVCTYLLKPDNHIKGTTGTYHKVWYAWVKSPILTQEVPYGRIIRRIGSS
jgi:hypothetical protein